MPEPPLTIVDHPVAAHQLAILRDPSTTNPHFRAACAELGVLLAVEATRALPRRDVRLSTARGEEVTAQVLAEPMPVLVPVLRAGLGLLQPFLDLLPDADVGFVGAARDEETLQPTVYAERMPERLADRPCFVLEPMIATGGSLAAAVGLLRDRGATSLTVVSVLATEQGIAVARQAVPDLAVVTAAVDPDLDDQGYIVPGLGDAGDRLFGD